MVKKSAEWALYFSLKLHSKENYNFNILIFIFNLNATLIGIFSYGRMSTNPKNFLFYKDSHR